MRPFLVTITAPTCSGKSFLLDTLVNRGIVQRIVSTTTRRRRRNEEHGCDYYFIDEAESLEIERGGGFFELITFNGTRYGVTWEEMQKMRSPIPPAVVLEPQGLEIYRIKCLEQGWDVFSIFVYTTEDERIMRMVIRACSEMRSLLERHWTGEATPAEVEDGHFDILQAHTSRLLLATGDERTWSSRCTWSVRVPGDDIERAINDVQQALLMRKEQSSPPRAIGAVELPIGDARSRAEAYDFGGSDFT